MRWVLLVVSSLVAVVLGEAVASVLADEVYLQRRTRMGGILVPYEPGAVADLLTDEFRVRYEINRFGHRDRLDREAARRPGVTRTVLLGDSFAAGWGVEFEDTFGYRIEDETGMEMVNAAKNGGCPLWFLPQGRYLRGRFSPDWLLIQLFDNDPEDNAIYTRRFELEIGERYVSLPERLEPLRGIVRQWSHEFDSSVLRRRFRQLARRLKGKRLHSTPYVKPGRKPDHLVLTRSEAIAKHGVVLDEERPLSPSWSFHDPALAEAWEAKIAWNTQLLDQLLEEARIAGVRAAVLYIPTYEVFLRGGNPNPLALGAREATLRNGAVWIDAQQGFQRVARPWELYHAYDGHLNTAGHAAVAELLRREWLPHLELPPSGGEIARVTRLRRSP